MLKNKYKISYNHVFALNPKRCRNYFLIQAGEALCAKDTVVPEHQQKYFEITYVVDGKGISYIASRKLLEYAFDIIGVNKVYLNVDADNIAACNLYEKLGFRCEGIFIEDMMHRNKLIDRKRYAILKRNWNSAFVKEVVQ